MPKYDIHPDFLSFDKRFKVDFSNPYIVKALNALFGLSFRYGSNKKGIHIRKRTINGFKDNSLNLFIYKPENLPPDAPCLIYLHGGGFFLRGSFMSRKAAIYYARHLPCVVIYVDYSLSLTHPFPTALEEAYIALCWANEHASELGIDAAKIGIGGESAGGALSATVCQMTRDRNGPNICCQLLIYPVLDDKMETESMREMVDTPLWNRVTNQVMWDYYLKGVKTENVPYISAMRASSFKNLAPAYIETAEFDPLRDEGKIYAQKLEKEGVKVELNETKRTIHGYDIDYTHHFVKAQLHRRIAFFNAYFYPISK